MRCERMWPHGPMVPASELPSFLRRRCSCSCRRRRGVCWRPSGSPCPNAHSRVLLLVLLVLPLVPLPPPPFSPIVIAQQQAEALGLEFSLFECLPRAMLHFLNSNRNSTDWHKWLDERLTVVNIAFPPGTLRKLMTKFRSNQKFHCGDQFSLKAL